MYGPKSGLECERKANTLEKAKVEIPQDFSSYCISL